MTLHEMKGLTLPDGEIEYGIDYVDRLANHWYQYNDKIFTLFEELFGVILPDVWNVYVISCLDRGYGFSIPTTVTLSEDLDYMVAFIIHEISHLMLFMNRNSEKSLITKKTWDIVISKYPEDKSFLHEHILVQFMTFTIMQKLFGTKTAKLILARELDYKLGDIGKAWKILYENGMLNNKLKIDDFLQNI
jgi:hypothetical protein